MTFAGDLQHVSEGWRFCWGEGEGCRFRCVDCVEPMVEAFSCTRIEFASSSVACAAAALSDGAIPVVEREVRCELTLDVRLDAPVRVAAFEVETCGAKISAAELFASLRAGVFELSGRWCAGSGLLFEAVAA